MANRRHSQDDLSGLAEYHFSNIINAVNFRVVGFEDADDVARLQRGQKWPRNTDFIIALPTYPCSDDGDGH